MSKQAKTLSAQEIRRVLDYVATRKHSARNRAMLLTMYYAGLRVKECAALRYEDVLDAEGKIRAEIRLMPEQTKGSKAGTVFVSDKLRKELQAYVLAVPAKNIKDKLFYSQKRPSEGWNSNTLCQFFGRLYKNAGINGATSHSGRRKFCTSLSESGISTKVIMELSGHKHLSSLERYIAVTPQTIRKAIELA